MGNDGAASSPARLMAVFILVAGCGLVLSFLLADLVGRYLVIAVSLVASGLVSILVTTPHNRSYAEAGWALSAGMFLLSFPIKFIPTEVWVLVPWTTITVCYLLPRPRNQRTGEVSGDVDAGTVLKASYLVLLGALITGAVLPGGAFHLRSGSGLSISSCVLLLGGIVSFALDVLALGKTLWSVRSRPALRSVSLCLISCLLVMVSCVFLFLAILWSSGPGLWGA